MGNNRKYKGLRAGRLELVEYSRPGGKGVGSIWWAICECGNTTEVIARQVVHGRVKTCGNCGKGLGIQSNARMPLSNIPQGHKEAYKRIIRQLASAGVQICISPDNYVQYIGKRCIGCNTSDTHVELEMQPRVDNVQTHTQLVAICRSCSGWRAGRNVQEWLEYCIRIADSLRNRAAK